MNLDSLTAFIQSSSLDAEVKEVLVDRLEAEGLTPDTIDVLKDAFQDKMDELFDAAGVKLDPADPENAAALKGYQDELRAIQQDGAAGLAGLQADLKQQGASLQSEADAAAADGIRARFP